MDQKDIEKCHRKFESAAQLLHLALLPANRRDTTDTSLLPVENLETDELSTQESASSAVTHVQSTDESSTLYSIPRKPVAGSGSVSSPTRASFHPRRHWPHLNIQAAAELGIGNERSRDLWYPSLSNSIHGVEHSHRGIIFSAKQLHSLKLKEKREKHDVPHVVYVALKKASEAFGADTESAKWLYLATWWLIKSRAVWNNLAQQHGKTGRGQSASHTWENTLSMAQAWLDLCKSRQVFSPVLARCMV